MAKHILIVDDDTLMRRSLAFNLEQAAYRASTAANAEDAIAMVRREAPDLVLLDIGLPGMDGLDALRKFKEIAGVPVIFLTARRRELDGDQLCRHHLAVRSRSIGLREQFCDYAVGQDNAEQPAVPADGLEPEPCLLFPDRSKHHERPSAGGTPGEHPCGRRSHDLHQRRRGQTRSHAFRNNHQPEFHHRLPSGFHGRNRCDGG